MEAAASATTILQLVSFTGDVLIAGYGYLSKVRKAPAEVRAFLKETANLNALLDQLHTLFAEDANTHAMNAFETLISLGVFDDCRSLMKTVLQSIQACEQISGQGARNFGRRMLWPFKEKETRETLQQLGRLRETVSAAVAVDSMKTLINLETIAKTIDMNVIKALETTMQIQSATCQTSEDLAQLRLAFSDKANVEESLFVFSWLLPDGVYTETGFEASLKLRHPSTGQWLLNSDIFRDWLNRQSGCIWVYGIPGCGKTVLSTTAIEYLQKEFNPKNSTVLYFFGNRRNPRLQTLQDCLHILTKQLLDRNLDFFNDAKEYYRERLQKSQGQQGAPPLLSIDENVSLLKQFCLKSEAVFVVIDALDECTDRGDFIHSLLSLSQGNPKVKFFITSRYEVELERLMSPISSHSLALKDYMKSDIRTYLTVETATRIAQGTLKIRQEGLTADIIAAIEEKADGMILIAKLQLDYICSLRSDRSIKEALHKLPTGINATYDEILQQLCAQHPESIDEIRLILQWLVGSTVPLTLDQLSEAVSIRPGDRRLERDGIATDPIDLAACCGSLVRAYAQETSNANYHDDLRGSGTTLISLSHASVEEYLTSPAMKLRPLKLFFMDMPSVHRELAKTSLQYIGFEDFQYPVDPIVHSKTNGPGHSKWYLNRERLRQRTSQYVLYDYACTHWATHLRLSRLSNDDGISELLQWFLVSEQYSGCYKSWQQMYHHDIQHYCPGRPSLHYAIEFGVDFLTKMLLPEKQEVDNLYQGMAALHEAAKCGDIAMCQTLLDQEASLELKSGSNCKSMTALHFAAEGGHSAVIELLLARGASPHARSSSQSTPLYRAARSGSLKALKILYSAGSDINARTWDNWTPLFETVARGLVHIANQLLEWGADPTITTYSGESPLTLIVEAKNNAYTNQSLSRNAKLDPSIESDLDSSFPKILTDGETAILQEIRELQAQVQAQASTEKTGNTFYKYLVNIMPGIWKLESIETDTRPGIERDKFRLRTEDGYMAFNPDGYLLSYICTTTGDKNIENRSVAFGLRNGITQTSILDSIDKQPKSNLVKTWTCCECGHSGQTIYNVLCSMCSRALCACCEGSLGS